jgi:hypothetical protein
VVFAVVAQDIVHHHERPGTGRRVIRGHGR